MLIVFRYRIIPAATPGMASEDALCTQVNAFEHAPFLDSFYRVMRARRCKAARRPKEWRNELLVHPDRKNDEIFQRIFQENEMKGFDKYNRMQSIIIPSPPGSMSPLSATSKGLFLHRDLSDILLLQADHRPAHSRSDSFQWHHGLC